MVYTFHRLHISDLKHKIARFLSATALINKYRSRKTVLLTYVETVFEGVVATTFIENKYKFAGQDLWSCSYFLRMER